MGYTPNGKQYLKKVTSKHIEFFELQYDEQIVLQGEKLFSDHKVLEINKLDKNLYSILVKDGIIYEVEILSPQSKNRKSSCECDFFKDHKVCRHIIASLFYIRKRLIKDAAKSQERTKKKSAKAINIPALLQAVNEQELHNFIRAYTKKDKRFALHFKASFLKNLDLENNYIKYKQLLDSVIPPMRSVDDKPNLSSVRFLINILLELSAQFNDACALNQFTEAAQLLKACLGKICYTIHYVGTDKSELIDANNTFHQHLQELLEEVLAPQLRKELIQFAFELSTKSYYTFRKETSNVLEALTRYSQVTKTLLSEVIKHINALMESKTEMSELIILEALKLQITWKLKKKIDIKKINPALSHNLLEIFQELGEKKHYNVAIAGLNQLLIKYPENNKVISKLIAFNIEYGQTNQAADLAKFALIQQNEFRYYKILKDIIPSALWPDFSMILIEDIDASEMPSEIKARIYKLEETYDLLLSLLKKDADLRFLMEHDNPMAKLYKEEMAEVYIAQVRKYLDSYAGPQAMYHIQEVLRHLEVIKASFVGKKIREILREDYAHRTNFKALS